MVNKYEPTQSLDVSLTSQLVSILRFGVFRKVRLSEREIVGCEANLSALLHRVNSSNMFGEISAGSVRMVALVLSSEKLEKLFSLLRPARPQQKLSSLRKLVRCT